MQLRTESEQGRVAFRVRRVGSHGDNGRLNTGTTAISVAYDIEVRVPRDATIEIVTVNDGDVSVEDVNGDFDREQRQRWRAAHVRARGGGSIKTVNGHVDATFERALAGEATSFKPSTARST